MARASPSAQVPLSALRRRRAPDAPTLLDADLPCGCGARRDAGLLLPVPGAPGERACGVGSRPWITLRPRRSAYFSSDGGGSRATAGRFLASRAVTRFRARFRVRLCPRLRAAFAVRRSGPPPETLSGSGSGGGASRQIVSYLAEMLHGCRIRSPHIRAKSRLPLVASRRRTRES